MVVGKWTKHMNKLTSTNYLQMAAVQMKDFQLTRGGAAQQEGTGSSVAHPPGAPLPELS